MNRSIIMRWHPEWRPWVSMTRFAIGCFTNFRKREGKRSGSLDSTSGKKSSTWTLQSTYLDSGFCVSSSERGGPNHAFVNRRARWLAQVVSRNLDK
jgi:hypothetical protein